MFGPPSLGKFACGTKKATTAASSETTPNLRPKSLLFQRMSHIEAIPTPKPADPEPADTNQDEDGPEPGNYPGHKDEDRPNTAEKTSLGLVDYTSVFASLKKEDEANEEDSYAYAEEDAEPEVKHGFVKLTKGNLVKNGGDPVQNSRNPVNNGSNPAKNGKGKGNGNGNGRANVWSRPGRDRL